MTEVNELLTTVKYQPHRAWMMLDSATKMWRQIQAYKNVPLPFFVTATTQTKLIDQLDAVGLRVFDIQTSPDGSPIELTFYDRQQFETIVNHAVETAHDRLTEYAAKKQPLPWWRRWWKWLTGGKQKNPQTKCDVGRGTFTLSTKDQTENS